MINGECRECHNWRASPAVAVRSANKVLVLIKQSVTSALVALAFLGGVAVQATAQVVPSGFTVDTLVNAGLPQPLDFAFLPDGRILVANRLGELHVYAGGAAVQVGVVPAVLSGGESGLLSMEVDPSFAQTGHIYVYYTTTADSFRHLDRFALAGDLANPASTNLTLNLASRRAVLDSIPDNSLFHNGGAARFGPDGMLYLTLGDDGVQCDTQAVASARGSVLRMDVAGLSSGGGLVAPTFSQLDPGDNPLSSNTDLSQLVIAYGLRQPFRFTIDSLTGSLYIGDVGSSAAEEVNEYTYTAGSLSLINYGWPWFEGTATHANTCSGSAPTGVSGPIAIGAHSAGWNALIQGPRYRNQGGPFDFGPAYEGSVFYAEYFGGWLRRLEDVNGWGPAQPVAGQPSSEDWASSLSRITAMRQGPDGAVYWTQAPSGPGSGKLRRVRPDVPHSATSYGSGCGNPALLLTTSAPPVLGAISQVTLANVPASIAFISGGLSNTTWGGSPLPASLAAFGMPGCELLQSAEEIGLPMTPTGAGTAAFDWTLPNQGSLIGFPVYLQCWALAPGQNPAGVVLSNGLEWVLGNS